MKTINITCVLLFIGSLAFSQTIPVSGTVNDDKGQPVPYAFVRDAQHNYATFADSTGAFFIKADPASSLEVSAVSYKDAALKIDNKTNVKVTLPAGAADGNVSSVNSGNSDVNSAFLKARQQFVMTGGSAVNSNMAVREGFTQEPTRGSRYLFENWVPGFGISKKDSLVVEKTNLYNYDKINGTIIYSADGKSIAQLLPEQLKNFSLFDKRGRAHVYENAPQINGQPFAEVLLQTPKYKIYKKIDTKIIRADFHTDGVIEMGHRYDEYVDVEHYVFVNLADNKAQSISLKKSTLKKMLGGDADTFITSQGSRDVDEDYVRDLGNSLSK
ncbi:MAG: carboxypeptidase-like regulatory domain-containing protein [Mucilaginibacter sp.]